MIKTVPDFPRRRLPCRESKLRSRKSITRTLPSVGENDYRPSKTPSSRCTWEIFFEIRFGVAKAHAMFLEQLMNLEATLNLKDPKSLSFRQRAGPVALDGNCLEAASWDVVPSTLERRRDILRQVDGDLHDDCI